MADIEYRVIWEIDICAKSPKAAVKKALKIQRDPESTATLFDVWFHKVSKKPKSNKKIDRYIRKQIDLG